MRLDDQCVIITGAGRGIGRACALLANALGASVALISRNEQELDSVFQALPRPEGKNWRMVADIGEEDQVREVFARASAKWGRIDALVNAAAIFRKSLVQALEFSDWEEVLRVNLTGTWLMCREAFRCFPPGSAIVNFSSLSGVPGVEKFPGFSAYNVSKYGVAGLTEILAVEGRSMGIRVNSVSPGAVDTDMLRQAAPHLTPAMSPEAVAEVVIFLLSGHSRAIHGANLVLAGEPCQRLEKDRR